MKRKLISALLSVAMVSTLLVGCGSSAPVETPSIEAPKETQATEAGDTGTASTGAEGSIRIVNGKIEIDSQLKAFATKYEEETGVHVEIESIGGGADINGTLKGYLAADNMPDIFVFGGVGDYNTWKEQMEDLSNEAWAKDTDVAFTGDGKVVGFPYAIEGYGITYNKELLDKAGIDPATLTSYGAYEAAFKKIDGMKAELGIDAVLAMGASVSGGLTWSTGNHNFGSYLSTGLERDDTSLIDGLNEGKVVDRARLDQYAKFVDMLFKYSDSYVLKSGNYDEQLALWEDGKTVFIHQGNWIDPNLITDGVTFEVGMSPLAFMEEETDGILADAPSWWAVYNGSANVQSAKDFLTALGTTDAGFECLVKDSGMISPFTSCTVEPEAPLAKNVMKWVSEGKTYAWHWGKMPDGFGMDVLGPVFESLATGSVDAAGFADMVAKVIEGNAK